MLLRPARTNRKRGGIITKDELTGTLRQRINQTIPEAVETDRADESLCTLSFQSAINPNRHLWIDTDNPQIKLDLEDWQDEQQWDNAIARITVESLESAVDITKAWLCNGRLESYTNINQEYELVQKKSASLRE